MWQFHITVVEEKHLKNYLSVCYLFLNLLCKLILFLMLNFDICLRIKQMQYVDLEVIYLKYTSCLP